MLGSKGRMDNLFIFVGSKPRFTQIRDLNIF